METIVVLCKLCGNNKTSGNRNCVQNDVTIYQYFDDIRQGLPRGVCLENNSLSICISSSLSNVGISEE